MANEVRVGIGDLNVVENPGKIITIGLGSCIGIFLYDRRIKVGGLSHIMLPDSTQFSTVTNPMKFADLAIPMLLKKMQDMGCFKNNIVAKIAGGASMFKFGGSSASSDIGRRNCEMVKHILKDKEGIPILSEETGGNKGRTMIANAEDGTVTIKVIGQEAFTI
ncbi:chemotaxis protein CheD [Clostridium sp. HCP1S3_B4]|uniref:chemotaxis protein CheD n=1 Tax=unclassified Clostridium TaxID=2614128 RepID=UPI002A7AF222|nr:chemotaxis protein CheD [Clostridium sp.]